MWTKSWPSSHTRLKPQLVPPRHSSPMACPPCPRHLETSCPARLTLHWPAAAAWFVCQTLQSIVQKARGPLVDKTPCDPHHRGDMGDRYPIGQEQDNPPPSVTPRPD